MGAALQRVNELQQSLSKRLGVVIEEVPALFIAKPPVYRALIKEELSKLIFHHLRGFDDINMFNFIQAPKVRVFVIYFVRTAYI